MPPTVIETVTNMPDALNGFCVPENPYFTDTVSYTKLALFAKYKQILGKQGGIAEEGERSSLWTGIRPELGRDIAGTR
jgi:hypothetical protein